VFAAVANSGFTLVFLAKAIHSMLVGRQKNRVGVFMGIKLSSETDTVIKKIVPYLLRRGYDLQTDLDFEVPTVRAERLTKGYVDLLIGIPGTKPAFLIEAKRSGKSLTDSDRQQALTYGKGHKVPFVVVTNGSDIRCFNTNTGETVLWDAKVREKIPTKEQLKTVLAHLKKNKDASVVPLGTDYSMPFRPGLSPKQLNALFYRAHSDIRKIEKSEEHAFQDFSKILFLKLLEEKYDSEGRDLDELYTYRFHELAGLPDNKADQIRDAVTTMLKKLSSKGYGDVLLEPITLKNPRSFQSLVRRVAAVSFIDSSFDSKGAAFEYYVRATLKGKKLGQYFTPRPVIHLMSVLIGRKKVVKSLMSGENVRVVDPACGTGGFLVYLMKQGIEFVVSAVNHNELTKTAGTKLIDRLRYNTFFGADANESVASAAKMNMIIAGDGHSNIAPEDSLSKKSTIWSFGDPKADLIITNPPFGTSEADSLTKADLEQYPLQTPRGQLLFLQKMVGSVKPGSGEICTVIDEGVLNTESAADLRRWLLRTCRLKMVIRLPEVTFKPNKINVRSSVLYLGRFEHEDLDQESKYDVAFVDVKSLGYQGSGVPIRGFDELAFMEEIEKFFRKPTKDGRHVADAWATFRVPISKIYADPTCRFDLKFWEPLIVESLQKLSSNSCPTLQNLSDVGIRRGKSPASESYVDESDGYALVVKAGSNISKYGELIETGDFIEKVVFEEMGGCQLQVGDILLASTGTGTLGKCCVFRSKKPAIADGHVTIIRLDQTKIHPEYVCDYLRLGFGASQIQRLFTGSTGLIELTPDQVKSILIELEPELEKQIKISKTLREIERRYLSALEAAESEFDSMRHEFFKTAPFGPSLAAGTPINLDVGLDASDAVC
jgi:type I restriction enzyme M protein